MEFIQAHIESQNTPKIERKNACYTIVLIYYGTNDMSIKKKVF